MWIDLGVAQFRGNAIFKPLGNKVFEPFGFVVNFVPRISQHIVEESLQEPVVTKNFESPPVSRSRQENPMMFFIFDKERLLPRELLEHSGNGCRTDPETLGQRVAGHAFFFWSTQLQDGFQIIVDRFRVRWQMVSRRH